jgi:recombinational DNA repair protein (RecF pathway)
MRENLENLKRAFYAQELVLKFTADEHKNEPLFFLLENFLDFLDLKSEEKILDLGLLKFKLEILRVLGLATSLASDVVEAYGKSDTDNNQGIFFSTVRGGFSRQASADSLKVSDDVYRLFLELKDFGFGHLQKIQNQTGEKDLQNLLSQFIEYQLERKVKSEKYLRQ